MQGWGSEKRKNGLNNEKEKNKAPQDWAWLIPKKRREESPVATWTRGPKGRCTPEKPLRGKVPGVEEGLVA